MIMRLCPAFAVPLLACAASASAQSPAVIDVHLANFSFTPRSIVLDHGRQYTLRLINDAAGGHDFTAKSFFAAASVPAADRALLDGGSIEVPAHQAREIHVTAPAPGSHKLKCTHTLHSALGMTGTIVIR
jgi:uncharacterized cupredoxin-like copper-binding protein